MYTVRHTGPVAFYYGSVLAMDVNLHDPEILSLWSQAIDVIILMKKQNLIWKSKDLIINDKVMKSTTWASGHLKWYTFQI